MKRLSFAICALLASVALFTACSKDETASAVNVDMAKTATVKGYIYAEQDVSNDKTERVANAKITVKIANSDLNSRANSGYWTLETTTNASGEFSVSVPTTDNGVTVEVYCNAFEGSVTQSGDAAAKNAKYYGGSTSTEVYPNDNAVVSYTYDYSYIGNN